MKRQLLVLSAAFILTFAIFQSCTFDEAPRVLDCDNLSDISFATDVLPILTTNCATTGCHDDATGSSGYRFGNYTNTKEAVDGGRVVGAINHENGFSNMPASFQLQPCEIDIIETWLNEGALDN